jgi:hypothetical protein
MDASILNGQKNEWNSIQGCIHHASSLNTSCRSQSWVSRHHINIRERYDFLVAGFNPKIGARSVLFSLFFFLYCPGKARERCGRLNAGRAILDKEKREREKVYLDTSVTTRSVQIPWLARFPQRQKKWIWASHKGICVTDHFFSSLIYTGPQLISFYLWEYGPVYKLKIKRNDQGMMGQ